MAKASSATTSTVTGLSWFKVYQAGLNSDGTWASDKVNAAGGKLSFTIPRCIAAGQHLIRGETIGLHVASTYPGHSFIWDVFRLILLAVGVRIHRGFRFRGLMRGRILGLLSISTTRL
ncbi:hypothetical protein L873DRAFT_1085730 [Choiromyces venosus 120613-1]|uniref:AA9 family lytic polysaccharide monooxygenase n=1 Tax=Choiromyces venosus 120613-1 TaxID=1336337 RepID=A0A3N4JLT6_9PEZI|nr:hypothetical protein L873DRAFT_1085730 [Choiromyces venosus 120613-1]